LLLFLNLNFKRKKAFFKANKEKLAYWIELVINDKDFCIEKYEVLEFILSFSWEELESVPGLEKLILIIVEHILMFGASEYGDDFIKFVSSRGRKISLEIIYSLSSTLIVMLVLVCFVTNATCLFLDNKYIVAGPTRPSI
jgi:hypothetical protein